MMRLLHVVVARIVVEFFYITLDKFLVHLIFISFVNRDSGKPVFIDIRFTFLSMTVDFNLMF